MSRLPLPFASTLLLTALLATSGCAAPAIDDAESDGQALTAPNTASVTGGAELIDEFRTERPVSIAAAGDHVVVNDGGRLSEPQTMSRPYRSLLRAEHPSRFTALSTNGTRLAVVEHDERENATRFVSFEESSLDLPDRMTAFGDVMAAAVDAAGGVYFVGTDGSPASSATHLMYVATNGSVDKIAENIPSRPGACAIRKLIVAKDDVYALQDCVKGTASEILVAEKFGDAVHVLGSYEGVIADMATTADAIYYTTSSYDGSGTSAVRRLAKTGGPSTKVAEGTFADRAKLATDGKVLVVLGARDGDVVRLAPTGETKTIGHIEPLRNGKMTIDGLAVADKVAYASIRDDKFTRIVQARLERR